MKKEVLSIFIFFMSMILIEVVSAIPLVSFTDSSPVDGANVAAKDLNIIANISESNLANLIFSFDGTNYSMFSENLVLMYNFDNVSELGENSTHVVDLSGNGFNGTVTNASWSSSGKYGGSFSFNNSIADSSSRVTTGQVFDGGEDWTISMWVNQNRQDMQNQGTLLDAHYTNGILLQSAGTQHNGLELYIKSGAAPRLVKDFFEEDTDNWIYLTLVLDSGQSYLYKNTVLVNSSTYSGNPNNAYFYVGGGYNKAFDGGIDEVRVWNKSFSHDEIKKAYYSNLKKYNSENWTFSFFEEDVDTNDNLIDVGSYNYFIYAENSSGSGNSSGQRLINILTKILSYYDDRHAGVIVTGDDWTDSNDPAFVTVSNLANSLKFIFSPGIITGGLSESTWQNIQTAIDSGYVSPISHSVNHDNTDGNEPSLSLLHLVGNLTFPWQNTFNDSEYMVGWIEPGGSISVAQIGNLTTSNYLVDRELARPYAIEYDWAQFNHTLGYYYDLQPTTQADNGSYDECYSPSFLNSIFDTTYAKGGIYHLYSHPSGANYGLTDGGNYYEHLEYIGNRNDVWYVGFGQAYMYHYLEDRIPPKIEIEEYSDNQLIANMTANGTERNKFGLSYPLTYEFAVPSIWNNIFVFYKNQSNEDYVLMTEKTRNEYWTGIEAYRTNLTGHSVYISKSFPQTSNEFYLKIVPVLSTNFDDSTTDLTAVNLSSISNLIIEKSSYGQISFSQSVDLSAGANLNSHVSISNNYISIDSSALPALNKPATLSLYGLTFSNPRVLRNGAVCPSSVCTEVSYSGGTFTFTVTGFSSYSAEETPSGGYPTYKPNQSQLEDGYEKSLRENWKIQFEFENETRTIKLDNIINKTAIITVSSEPQTFNLTVNQTKKLNLNDDGFYDLQIFLKNITGGKADLIVKSIHEEIPAELLEEEEKGILERIKGVINNFIGMIKPYWLWILIGVGSIIIIVILIIRRIRSSQ